jgi:hypothetical protein
MAALNLMTPCFPYMPCNITQYQQQQQQQQQQRDAAATFDAAAAAPESPRRGRIAITIHTSRFQELLLLLTSNICSSRLYSCIPSNT